MNKRLCLTVLSACLSIVNILGQVSQTVNISKAGSLTSTIGNNLNSITDLTLTGSINSTDFQGIKNMPALKNLNLKNVKVDNNVIPMNAFRDKILNSLVLPDGLVTIADSAFYGSKITQGITLPSGLQVIGNLAFANTSTKIDFSKTTNSLKHVGYQFVSDYKGAEVLDFSNYSNLVEFDYLGRASMGAFTGFKGLIILPNALDKVPDFAFALFEGSVSLHSGIKSVGKSSFLYATMQKIDLPNGLETISYGSFQGAHISQGLVLPATLNSIGSLAFANSSTKVDFSKTTNSLKSVGYQFVAGYMGANTLDFSNYSKLTDFGFWDRANVGAFTGYAGLVVLPAVLTSIPDYCFAQFNGSVKLHNGLRSTGYGVFTLSKMKSLTLPDGLESVGDASFYDASIADGLALPASLSTIGSNAFAYSTTKVDFSKAINSLKSVGYEFVSGYTGSKVLDFSKFTKLTELGFIERAQVGAFSGYEGTVTLPSVLEKLPDYSFANFKGSVNILNGLKAIGSYVFQQSSISEIKLPQSITSIGDKAFFNASLLKKIISENPTPPSLGTDVFLGVNKETTILEKPRASNNLYNIANQWKDFLKKILSVPTSIKLSYRIGSWHNPSEGVFGVGQNTYEFGTIEAEYKAVRIGEYYWMTQNFNHEEPTRTSFTLGKPSGIESEYPLTQSTIDKYLTIVGIDKNQYQIDIKEFIKYFGVYYGSASREYMSTWGKMYEDNATESNPQWNLPYLRDYRQLMAMSDFRHYAVKDDTLRSRDVLYTLSAKQTTNPMSKYILKTSCTDHTGNARTDTDWFGFRRVSNKYGFDLMLGGARMNEVKPGKNEEWYTADCYNKPLKVEWAQTGDLYHHFYTTELATREGFLNLHDYINTAPAFSHHFQHTRWCRPLTDQELGYRLYINIFNIDKNGTEWQALKANDEIPLLLKYRYSSLDRSKVSIIKLGLDEVVPEGYIELPHGYIRGFYVNYLLDNPAPAVDIAKVISYACQVEDTYLMNGNPLKDTEQIDDRSWDNDSKPNLNNTSSSLQSTTKLSLYPNPVKDVLKVAGQKVEMITVYNLDGHQLESISNANSIEMADLKAGTYIVKVVTAQGESVHKVMKK